jgi:hypothetical protein
MTSEASLAALTTYSHPTWPRSSFSLLSSWVLFVSASLQPPINSLNVPTPPHHPGCCLHQHTHAQSAWAHSHNSEHCLHHQIHGHQTGLNLPPPPHPHRILIASADSRPLSMASQSQLQTLVASANSGCCLHHQIHGHSENGLSLPPPCRHPEC